jgi:hypothetical protein
MTKQMKAAMAAMLMVGTLPMVAQTSQTDVVKVAPGQTKKTVIHRKNGATDTVISEGTSGTGKKKPVHHTVKHRETSRVPVESATERKIRELEEKQAAQQAQIDALTAAGAAKDAALAQAQQAAQGAEAQAQAATAQAQSVQATVQQNSTDVQALKSNVTDLQTTNAGLASTISANKVELTEKIESPTTIHYKGVTIQPVAFFAGEGVFRDHSANSDIPTPFNSIPFPSANEGHVSELNFSSRQSRLGALIEGKAKDYKISGYFEADFLGTGATSNNNQSNSYVFRQRVIWGQVATPGGFTMTGGQMWSLVTEDGKGTDNRTEKLPNTIDPNYMVGYSWERQPGFRIQQKFGDYNTGAVTIAASVEQAQITGYSANATTAAGNTASALPAQYFFAGTGQNGGLYNAAAAVAAGNAASTSALTTYANNVAPDVVVKFAFDQKYGHIEVGGLARFLRDYYYPVTSFVQAGTAAAPTYTYTYGSTYTSNTKTAGGVFGSIRGSAGKYADIAVQAMAGPGVGRYGSAQLADATLRPDETLEPVRDYHGLFSLETHPAKKLDVYAYYGGEYAQRTLYSVTPTDTTTTPNTVLIGYGSPQLSDAGCYALPTFGSVTSGTGGSVSASGTCQSPTKYIQEGMIGFTYRVITNPKYGRLQYQATYSYVQRQLWGGVGSASTPPSPRADDSIIHVSMRYYIP